MLKDGHYPSAIQQFKLAENARPHDWKIKRDLGIAYYKTSQYPQAIEKLNQAYRIHRKDGRTLLYLGLSYEKARSFLML